MENMENLLQQVDGLSHDDFERLIYHIGRQKRKRARNILADAQRQAGRFMDFNNKQKSRVVRFANPQDPDQTWSGILCLRDNQDIFSTMLKPFERLKKIREQASVSPQELADITHVCLASQYNYEKGTRKPDIDYLTRLYEAGFDVMYLLTGERDVQTLSEEEKALLEVWYRADPAIRKAAWIVLTSNGDQGGESVFQNATRQDL